MNAVNNTKMVCIIRETHVAHNSQDIKDPAPVVSLFEYIIGEFNEIDYEEKFDRIWSYEAAEYLARMLREAGFRVYIFGHEVYSAVLFVKVTDNLYAVIVPPEERDEDLPVVHPIYILTYDRRIELPQVAQLITYFWLDKVRSHENKLPFNIWIRIIEGLDEVIVEFDFEKRKARCKRIPVYRTRKDKLLASSSL